MREDQRTLDDLHAFAESQKKVIKEYQHRLAREILLNHMGQPDLDKEIPAWGDYCAIAYAIDAARISPRSTAKDAYVLRGSHVSAGERGHLQITGPE